MKNRAQLRTELQLLVKDVDGYLSDPDDFNSEVVRALAVLSRRSPLVSVEDYEGDGTFQLALPSGFVVNQSQIIGVQYPFDKTAQTRQTTLKPNEYDVFLYEGTTYKLRIKTTTPSAGEVLRLTYTKDHALAEDSTTITLNEDEESLLHYAASLCFRIMAAKSISVTEPTQSLMNVNYQARRDAYMNMAAYHEGISGLKNYAKPCEGAVVFSQLPEGTDLGESYLTTLRGRRDDR